MTFPAIGETTVSKCRAGMCSLCAMFLLCIFSACCARAMQTPAAAPSGSHVPLTKKAAHPARKHGTVARRRKSRARSKKEAPPLSPAEAAAQPATVSLKNGKLTVEANNSNLTQILQDVAHISGMTIDGLDKDARVFGAFGPGNPRDVLTHLLVGSGYNFVMAGDTTDGAPRQLLLTAQNNNAPALTPASSPVPVSVPTPATSASPLPDASTNQEAPQGDPNASTTDANASRPWSNTADPQINPDALRQVQQEQQEQQNQPDQPDAPQ